MEDEKVKYFLKIKEALEELVKALEKLEKAIKKTVEEAGVESGRKEAKIYFTEGTRQE